MCSITVNQTRIVNVFDSNYYPLTWRGKWECVSWSGSVCLQANTHYNLYHTFTTTDARNLACHENGHVPGLAHLNDGTGACMHESKTSYVTWDIHNWIHINSWY